MPETDAIRVALTRRVLDMLGKMSADDYAKCWSEFGQTLKEGIIEDKANSDRLMKLLRFASTVSDGPEQDQSLDDYIGRMIKDQDSIYYILGETWETAKSSPHLEQLQKQGIEVLLLADRIDPWLVDHLGAYDGKEFQDVSRGQLSLPDGDGETTREPKNDEHKSLLEKLKRSLGDQVETVNVSQRLVDSPACVVTGEQDLTPQLRRMLEASGQDLPESKPILEINVEHPLLVRLAGESAEDRFGELARIVLDHALLAEGSQLDNPADYVRRVNQLILDLDGDS